MIQYLLDFLDEPYVFNKLFSKCKDIPSIFNKLTNHKDRKCRNSSKLHSYIIYQLTENQTYCQELNMVAAKEVPGAQGLNSHRINLNDSAASASISPDNTKVELIQITINHRE